MTGELTHSPEAVVAHALVAGGLGTLPEASGSWPIWSTYLPDDVTQAVSVKGEEGTLSGRKMVDGEHLEHYGIQILVRDSDEETGRAKAHAIARHIDTQIRRTSVTIPATSALASASYMIHSISRLGAVIPLGQGEAPNTTHRMWSINAKAAITKNS